MSPAALRIYHGPRPLAMLAAYRWPQYAGQRATIARAIREGNR
jgi:hypothetical protein